MLRSNKIKYSNPQLKKKVMQTFKQSWLKDACKPWMLIRKLNIGNCESLTFF